MSGDDYSGLHRRFDKLEENFDEVRTEQHTMSKSLGTLNHRIDLMEFQVAAAQKREELVVHSINEKLAMNTSLIEKLFQKYEAYTTQELEDRKKLLFWLVSCVVSVVGTATVILFHKVFG